MRALACAAPGCPCCRCSALTGEACSLRGALAQEQSERARLLGGVRGALTGLGAGCGDAEGRLRKELLDAHQVLVGFVPCWSALCRGMAGWGEAGALRRGSRVGAVKGVV